MVFTQGGYPLLADVLDDTVKTDLTAGNLAPWRQPRGPELPIHEVAILVERCRYSAVPGLRSIVELESPGPILGRRKRCVIEIVSTHTEFE